MTSASSAAVSEARADIPPYHLTERKQESKALEDIATVPAERPFYQVADQRGFCEGVADCVSAICRQLFFCCCCCNSSAPPLTESREKAPFPILGDRKYHFALEDMPWRKGKESSSLYLLIHGLNGKPHHWSSYQNYLEKVDPKATVLVPHVPLKGNCPLEESAEPFLELVADYIARNPKKPVKICSFSNGSRISAYIETHLNPQHVRETSFSFVSIAGIYGGTSLINRLQDIHLLGMTSLHPKLAEEIVSGSPHSQALVAALNERQRLWQREGVQIKHLFFATRNDELLYPLETSFPTLHGVEKESYRPQSGFTHETLIEGVKEEVFKWL